MASSVWQLHQWVLVRIIMHRAASIWVQCLTSPPFMRAQVWERLRKELMKRYVQLEEQMVMCYPSLQLVPSPQEMEAMCKAAAAAG